MTNNILDYLIIGLALIFILVTHEYAHAIVAYWSGDDTAKKMGRLTLNPLKHLDLMGTISLFLFKFGWAKPVPINIINFKNKKLNLFLVAIAGVVLNLITAFIAVLIIFALNSNLKYLNLFLFSIAQYGILLFIFNLIPIPPLDGSRVMASILPSIYEKFIFKFEKYFNIILFLLVMSGFINKIIEPIYNFIMSYFVEIALFIFGRG